MKSYDKSLRSDDCKMSKKDTVILFQCYYLNRNILREFYRIKNSCQDKFDVVLLYDNSRNDLDTEEENVYCYNITGIKKLRYVLHSNGLWFNPEFAVLDFFLNNLGYKYYWRVEYDLTFTGKWNFFFESFLGNDMDLLALRVRKYDDKKNWYWWSSFFPRISNNKKISILFTLQRFSNRALHMLNEKYSVGFSGFCEVTVPTILHLENLRIQDIGEEWYVWQTTLNCSEDEKVFFSKKLFLQKNKLYHPVKNISNLRTYIFKSGIEWWKERIIREFKQLF